ncbi:nucleotidyltransferase domain-containing protein [Halomicroarcula sp. F28]|uniref:nucleotidyltransferase domain-containing protein n=1 Tax=Haloarcula salinisoli TaxID=2487746 RepID=UPI001C738BA0|nr:nucleotidyltransferase domain-containing protein [Halomicroarcula salinisoli]MBX0286603.1 nucleotidyltransferase domain-containing protein [Halomicroarcula salinisoli]
MTTPGDRSAILDGVASSVCPDPDVEYVVAFGSQVFGESTVSSDLDLAVKFVDDLSDHERFEKWCFLSGDLQREDAPFVDVADIKMLPLDVAHDVVNGEFVCGDEEAFEQFKQEIEVGYSEHRETTRREQQDVIDRVAEDGLSQ